MKKNDLLKCGEVLVRVLDIKNGQAFIVDCKNKSVPKWVSLDWLSDSYTYCSDELNSLPDINDLDSQSRKLAYERFTLIAGLIPYISDKKLRCSAISQISDDKGILKTIFLSVRFHIM